MEFITWDTGGFPLPYNCSLPVSLTSVVASLLQKNISKLKFSSFPFQGAQPWYVRCLLGKFCIQLVDGPQLSQPAVDQRWMSAQLMRSGCLPIV